MVNSYLRDDPTGGPGVGLPRAGGYLADVRACGLDAVEREQATAGSDELTAALTGERHAPLAQPGKVKL
jgi:hypothetical protein